MRKRCIAILTRRALQISKTTVRQTIDSSALSTNDMVMVMPIPTQLKAFDSITKIMGKQKLLSLKGGEHSIQTDSIYFRAT